MIIFSTHLGGVVAATMASTAIGILWYSPLLFGRQVVTTLGLTSRQLKQKQPQIRKLYGLNFGATLITVWALSLTLKFLMATTLWQYLGVSSFVWAGFSAPLLFNTWLFSEKPFALYLIDASFQLVVFLLMGGILFVTA